MHWVLWLVVALVALSVVAWFAFELVPFVLYPLVAAAGLLAAWGIARRFRGRGA
ncbi:MAG TPA: hypothetical protein VK358_16690 [Longimicrobium sp.]|nr:hypothetical protein [Longimicrobium sp.]